MQQPQQQQQPAVLQPQQSQQQRMHPPGHLQQQQQPQQEQATYPGYLHERKPGDKAHFCICCQAPIAVYGRLSPCLHAFCLTCASDMPKCFICLADINRIDRHTSPLYISAANLQSFPTEVLLMSHTQRLYKHLESTPQFGGQSQVTAGRPHAAAAPPSAVAAAAAGGGGGGGSWAGRMNAAAASVATNHRAS